MFSITHQTVTRLSVRETKDEDEADRLLLSAPLWPGEAPSERPRQSAEVKWAL